MSIKYTSKTCLLPLGMDIPDFSSWHGFLTFNQYNTKFCKHWELGRIEAVYKAANHEKSNPAFAVWCNLVAKIFQVFLFVLRYCNWSWKTRCLFSTVENIYEKPMFSYKKPSLFFIFRNILTDHENEHRICQKQLHLLISP